MTLRESSHVREWLKQYYRLPAPPGDCVSWIQRKGGYTSRDAAARAIRKADPDNRSHHDAWS